MRTPRSSRHLVPPLLLALAVGGCTSHRPDRVSVSGTSGDKTLLTPWGKPVPTGGTGGSGGGTAGGAAETLSGSAPKAAAGSAADGGSGTGSSTGSGGYDTAGSGNPLPPDAQSGALRAGTVDDNAHFSDYLAFLRQMSAAGVHGDPLDVTERHVVTVLDRDGKPVLAAKVALLDAGKVVQTARTHADGRALLFPNVAGGGDTVEVSFGGETVRRDLAGGSGTDGVTPGGATGGDLTVRLAAARPDAPVRLDLHFLVDTTGSMGDEIARLRTTIDAVAGEIAALPQKPDVRYGLTVYKDHGDAYVSRTHDFTDLATFRKELSTTVADGGGDTPEALDEAFHGAVNGPSWDSDHAVQIAFLVADASPHLDDGQSGPSYAKDVVIAQAKGIEVVPLASSGTDDPAELVFRELAEYSLGTFFFLTYGPDGRSPGDTTDRHVDGFQTGSLDELVVTHVKSRLAALDGKAAAQ